MYLKKYSQSFSFCSRVNRAGDTRGGRGAMPPRPHPPPPIFFRSKNKIGKKRKKGKSFKAKTIKRGCHQRQNVTVLAILERLEFKKFSCRPTMLADIPFQCSMARPLWNPFRRPWLSDEIHQVLPFCKSFWLRIYEVFKAC